MDQKDLKLVYYSSSSSSTEEKITSPHPKIAVVNPIQSVRPEIITDQPEHDETTEFDPDVSWLHTPSHHQVIINLNKSEEKVKFLNLNLRSLSWAVTVKHYQSELIQL